MLVNCRLCVSNLFIRAGNTGRWPASVKLVTLPYLTLPDLKCHLALIRLYFISACMHRTSVVSSQVWSGSAAYKFIILWSKCLL